MKFRYALMSMVVLLAIQNGNAQTKTYELKKGQAFDLLFINTIPESKETLDTYFKTAIPVGQAYGYMPQKGFKVAENLQGNYKPSTMIVGLWSDYAKREDFITDVTNEVPDFHEMRRAIWSSFFLTYWEVKEDKTIVIDDDRFHVLTAYWEADAKSFKKFKQLWINEATESGGEIMLEMEEGKSPVGYYHNPNHLTITSWESREAFNSFYEKNLAMDHEGVKHVNQLIIE
ncbi:MAG: hypothetical protein AAFY41_03555 [Bacteroidota bacterium]